MNKKSALLTIAINLLLVICSYAQPSEVPGTGIIDLRNSTVVSGDINNDGNIDLVISGIDDLNEYTTKVYSNNSDNTFTNLGANLIALIDGSIALADYNADGYLDITICGRDDSNTKHSRIYVNNQDNTFSDISAGLQGLCFGSLDWGDYDNDGDVDLLICGQDNSDPAIRHTLIYENTGNNNFNEIVTDIPGVSRGQASWGDINKDGYLDIALSGLGKTNNYITEIYVNNGDKTFSAHNANLTKLAFSEQHFIDYDNDGDLDFWISGQNISGTDMVKLYNNTLGNFSESLASSSFTPLWDASTSWGDYDADGDADLIYMGLESSTPTVYYYQNNNVDDFTLAEWGLLGVAEGDNAWLDFNNDNKLDFFISGSSSGGNKSILYQNDTINTNSAPGVPNGLSADVSGYKATLSWTAVTDAQTASAGLSYHLSLGTSTGNYNINASLNTFSSEHDAIKGNQCHFSLT